MDICNSFKAFEGMSKGDNDFLFEMLMSHAEKLVGAQVSRDELCRLKCQIIDMVDVRGLSDEDYERLRSLDKPLELCHFIYPGLDGQTAVRVHRQVADLVMKYPIRDICSFLDDLHSEKMILLPMNPRNAFDELHRLGMPGEDVSGYSYDNFAKNYRK